jgi:hypothetical protein
LGVPEPGLIESKFGLSPAAEIPVTSSAEASGFCKKKSREIYM